MEATQLPPNLSAAASAAITALSELARFAATMDAAKRALAALSTLGPMVILFPVVFFRCQIWLNFYDFVIPKLDQAKLVFFRIYPRLNVRFLDFFFFFVRCFTWIVGMTMVR